MENLPSQPTPIPLIIIAIINSLLAVIGTYALWALKTRILNHHYADLQSRSRKIMIMGIAGFAFHIGYLLTLVTGSHWAVFWLLSALYNTIYLKYYTITIFKHLKVSRKPNPFNKIHYGELFITAIFLGWSLFVATVSAYYFILAAYR